MSEESRHHHYIPQAYLKGFAQQQSKKNWQTNVTDLDQYRTFPTNVRNVCGERDFMRVDIEGYEPDKIEKELSALETKCIEAIRRVSDTAIFDGEDANLTLNLMSLLAVRSPEMRENLRGFHERVAKRAMDLTLATKERWETQLNRMRKAGEDVSDELTYEEMKAFHKSDAYKVTVAREYQIGTEFQMMGTVLEELARRSWTVYKTDGTHGEFITTNRPVTLSYVEPEKIPPLYRHSPGFAAMGTEVYFPLTRHAMLIGQWTSEGGSKIAQPSFIAAVNTHMIHHSFGKVFSRKREFLYATLGEGMLYDGKLLEHLKPREAKAHPIKASSDPKNQF